MTINGLLQISVFLGLLLVSVKPLGAYMAKVYQGEKTLLSPIVLPLERLIYHIAGIDAAKEMTWKTYTAALLVFNFLGIVLLYTIQRLQHLLPFNPAALGPVAPDLALNTAVSFVTNTNWQNYAGETTMSLFTQTAGLAVQNFLSAATGMAILIALIRGLARRTTEWLGNFWVDATRSILYILLPLSFVLAIFLVSQGVVQTLAAGRNVSAYQPSATQPTQQTLALGPVASQVAIKHIGTNGGGFMNANSAHPFENPTPLTDLVLIFAETVIAASLTYTYGKMIDDLRQGWAILTAMLILLTVSTIAVYAAEASGNPRIAALNIDQQTSDLQSGGNMEGKETRFGIPRSAIFSTSTTATSTGAIDSMHDSYTPLGGLVLITMMQLGEVVLGGVGSGLYSMLVFVLIAVFIAGLMVGRTPEYLGKKIEAYEMKMSALVILIMPVIVLGFTALSVITPQGKSAIFNSAAHGFSEILYAFTSQANNNGSAFAGLAGNQPFYNILGALAMLIGRFWTIVPVMALAGSLAQKKTIPVSAGTLPTHTPLFIGWVVAIILIVGALNFLPALALGPIVEHLTLIAGSF